MALGGYKKNLQKNKEIKFNLAGYGLGPRFLLAYWGVSEIGKVRKGIGENIRTLRKKGGLSQEALGEKAELHPVYLSHVERGTKGASVEVLWRLSKALRVSMLELFRNL
jgi:DNA-binding XRE family transcriptional regulator